MNQVPPPPPPPPPPGGPGGPGGGYVGPPAGAGSADAYSIGEGIGYGWAKFQSNLGPLLLSLIGVIVASIVGYILQIIIAAIISNFWISQLLGSGISIAFSLIGSYGVYRCVLQITRGETPTFQTIYDFSQLGVYFVPTLIMSIIVGIAFALCIIPGLIVFPLLMFTPYFALDKNMGGMDAVTASYEMAKKNMGAVILFGIVLSLFAAVGLIACCIGAVVTGLIAHVAIGRAYQLGNGQPVA